MWLRGACGAILVAFGVGFCTPLPAASQTFSTFDDFSSSRIDGARWSGYADTVRFRTRDDADGNRWNNKSENFLLRHPGFSTYNVTAHRRIVTGQLQLQLDSVGGRHPHPNVMPGYGRIGVSDRASSQSAVRVTVMPMAAEAPACRAQGESHVRAMLSASINASEPDVDTFVFARLVLERSSFAGDRIYAVLSRCRGGGTCDVAEDLARVEFNRAWMLGRAHTLTIRHQPATGTLAFVVAGGGLPAETRALRRPVPDDTSAITGFGVRVETVPANCPVSTEAPAERVEVMMDARFDDVRVAGP